MYTGNSLSHQCIRSHLGFDLWQATTPLSCHCLLAREFERVGVLRYKAMRDPQQWKEGFFVLQKANLFICPGNDGAAEDIINLKRLQELSESVSSITVELIFQRKYSAAKFTLGN